MIDGAVMDSELSPVSGGQGSALRSRRRETSVESVTRTPRHSPELQPSPYLSQTILPTDRSGQTEKFLADYGVKHRLSSVAFPHSNQRAKLRVMSIQAVMGV